MAQDLSAQSDALQRAAGVTTSPHGADGAGTPLWAQAQFGERAARPWPPLRRVHTTPDLQASSTPSVVAATEELEAANDVAKRLGQAALQASVTPGVLADEQNRCWKAAVSAAGTAIAAEKRLISARCAVADEARAARVTLNLRKPASDLLA